MARDGLTELDTYNLVFSALSHETRRHILVIINARGGSLAAGQIAERFHHSWPTVTRHLFILVQAGLLKVERKGRFRVYHLQRDRLLKGTDGWLQWFRD